MLETRKKIRARPSQQTSSSACRISQVKTLKGQIRQQRQANRAATGASRREGMKRLPSLLKPVRLTATAWPLVLRNPNRVRTKTPRQPPHPVRCLAESRGRVKRHRTVKQAPRMRRQSPLRLQSRSKAKSCPTRTRWSRLKLI